MQAKRLPVLIYAIALLVFAPTLSAHAGMTVYGLRDIYRLRLEEISFFIVLLLVCAFFIKVIWNYAVKGFAFLPKLKFLQSLCLSILFGLLTLLILTMISGIREVLTPEAWRKQGSSYRLNASSQEPVRRRGMEQLRSALFDYSKQHDGHFPASDFGSEIAEKLWEAPDQIGTHYIYSGGLTTNDTERALALEPLNFGDQRFVLFVSGELRSLSKSEIENLFSRKGQQ